MNPVKFLVLLLICPVLAAGEGMPSANFREMTSKPVPNAQLPAHIHPDAESGISLVADYGAKVEQGIPLYVINSSDHRVDFPSQDDDLYIRLETKSPEGKWRRAQAYRSSWCGNSYYPLSLNPGEHFKLFGYVPEKGVTGEIRYTFFKGDAVSTATHQGLYLPTDIDDANSDEMSVRDIPRTLCPGSLDPGSPIKDKYFASLLSDVWASNKLITSLTLWKRFGEIPRTKAIAERVRAALTSHTGGDDSVRNNISRLRNIIGSPFDADASATHLAKFCIARIEAPDPQEKLDDRMLWETLAELCRLNLIPEDMQMQVSRLAVAKRSSILFSDGLVNFATTEDMWALVSEDSTDPQIRYQAFLHLLLSNLTSEVVTFVMKGTPEDRSMVFAILSNGYDSGLPKAPQKLAVVKGLYTKAMSENPGISSMLLQTGEFEMDPGSFQFLAPTAVEALESEMKKSARLNTDYQLAPGERGWALLPGLVSALDPQLDNDLWRELATHRGYVRSEFSQERDGVWSKIVEHEFPMREFALQRLEKRGEPVKNPLPTKVTVSVTPRITD